MTLLQLFQSHWKKKFPNLAKDNCRLLLAVSGGIDSVVLTDLVARCGFDFRIAHCNFRLRGAESERDEQFVRTLGKKYGKEVLVQHFDTAAYAEEKKIAIQEAARELRYEWFASVRQECLIVTAHHADDNIETVLMHLFRGTGIRGLAGIQSFQADRFLLRPLLPFRKKELSDYARAEGLSFVEDASNDSDKYTRNFFRNKLIPAVKEVFPQAEENLLNTIDHLNGAAFVYNQAIRQQIAKLAERKGEELHIPVLKWKQAQPLMTITWELLKPYGFTATQTEEAIKMLDASNGSYLQSATHRLIHNRKWMIIAPVANEKAHHIIVEEEDKQVAFGEQVLIVEFAEITPQDLHLKTAKPGEAVLDASGIKFPLLLRPWKQGDYFYPLGMQKKKKLSRFLIDLKLSATDKEKVWVLETDKKIIWVIGYRIDDRFKLNNNTAKLLKFTCRNNP